jgi:hypothetical protein
MPVNKVHFGATASGVRLFSYSGCYIGFGLTITALQLFQGYRSWICGDVAAHGLRESRSIGAGLVALQAIGAILSFKYFSTAKLSKTTSIVRREEAKRRSFYLLVVAWPISEAASGGDAGQGEAGRTGDDP